MTAAAGAPVVSRSQGRRDPLGCRSPSERLEACDVEFDLLVEVQPAVGEGTQRITVVATGGGETFQLPVDIAVAAAAGGTVSLEADFPAQRGTTDQTFEFSLELRNDTPQPLTFSRSATGPRGWEVSVRPAGQERAASLTVGARGSQRLTLSATPLSSVEAATYPVSVEAVSGDHVAHADLAVEITGRIELQLAGRDGRLNTTATAGSAHEFPVTLTNSGTAPIGSLSLSGSGPSGWTVAFDPSTVTDLAAGSSAEATAVITPSADAVAGDYVVTLRATGEDASQEIEVRVTVETPPLWGAVGLILIVVAVGALAWVFRRFGRR